MDGTCDRCHVRARWEWWGAEGQRTLWLCHHHNTRHADALEDAGWIGYQHADTLAPASG